jgi:FAD synthase
MAEALGIIGTMFVVLYFSRKQTQALSMDIETKILNDLDERIHGITQMGVDRPEE